MRIPYTKGISPEILRIFDFRFANPSTARDALYHDEAIFDRGLKAKLFQELKLKAIITFQ